MGDEDGVKSELELGTGNEGFEMSYSGAQNVLTEIGIPNEGSLSGRILKYRDRLRLVPEGEEGATLDEITKTVREVCEKATVGDGVLCWRIRELGRMHANQCESIAIYRKEASDAESAINELRQQRDEKAARVVELEAEVRKLIRERDGYRKDYWAERDRATKLEAELGQLDAKSRLRSQPQVVDPVRFLVLPPEPFVEALRAMGVVGDVTVRFTK